MTSGGRLRLCAIVAAHVGILALALPAEAQTTSTGPTVVPDRTELNVGERVAMTITGFVSPAVIMTVCGNEARRGSVDCDLRGAQAREINRDGTPTLGSVIVSAPPQPCPCVIRVASDDNAEVAVAPITIVGHPVGEIVEPTEFIQPLVVEIDAARAPQGFSDRLRTSLGAATDYTVTVRVRNQATYDVTGIRATASYVRERYDDTRLIEIDDPGTLEAGVIWEQVVDVETPALTIGDVIWRADVSGTGPPVTATDTTSQRPIALYVLGVILLVDVLVLLWRLITRRRRARRATEPPDNPFLDDPEVPDQSGVGDVGSAVEAERQEPLLVS